MQSFAEFSQDFAAIMELYRRRDWRPPQKRRIRFSIVTQDEPFEPRLLYEFILHIREKTDIDFSIVGGGRGCFEVVLGSDSGNSEKLDRLIVDSDFCAVLLAELRAHVARLEAPTGTQTYAGYFRLKIGFITNRLASSTRPLLPDDFFTSEYSSMSSFGFISIDVFDSTGDSHTRSSKAGRIWKRMIFGDINLYRKSRHYEIESIDIVEQSDFNEISTGLNTQFNMLFIHGYANSFRDSVMTISDIIYKTGVDRLGYLPILFSWPSGGDVTQYFSDTTNADRSEMGIGSAVSMLAKQDKPLALLAHSHGSKLLVSSLARAGNQIPSKNDCDILLIEPDIDHVYLSNMIGSVKLNFRRFVVYHSTTDLALTIAERIFGAKRAGQIGIKSETASLLGSRLEFVDVSLVHGGRAGHSPHLYAAEIIYDIRDVLSGQAPQKRRLVPTTQPRCWQIRPLF